MVDDVEESALCAQTPGSQHRISRVEGNPQADQHVPHMAQARVSQHTLHLCLRPRGHLLQCQEVAEEHIQRPKDHQQQPPRGRDPSQRADDTQQSHQAGFNHHARKHRTDAAGRLRMRIGQPGVHGHHGNLDPKADDEQRTRCQQPQ